MMPAREARIPEPVGAAMNGATRSEWAVLFALYLHADANGKAYPSIGRIARTIGLDPISGRRSVTRALAALEKRIPLVRVRPQPGREHTVYYLPTRDNAAPSGLGTKRAGTRDATDPGLGTGRSHKQRPETEQPIEQGSDDLEWESFDVG